MVRNLGREVVAVLGRDGELEADLQEVLHQICDATRPALSFQGPVFSV